jgi:sensor histidine kinase regulating citrate/malate metabolism
MLINVSDFDEQTSHLLIGTSIGLLFVLIGIFVMYEMFVREETRNIDLSTRLLRLEMESTFFKELGAMQTDLRTWRHEYKNNLIALRALVTEGSSENILEYLDKISGESHQECAMLQTGNTVLDAVVSSKLMLANSRGIEVNLQAVYPETNNIENNDLCAIAGNLLDNAIEACERMSNGTQKRFISFSLLVKGKNLAISLINSYDGEIKRAGNRFLTAKNNPLHGIGIQYVDSIVDKYQGHVLREYQSGVFKTHIMLPLISAQGGDEQ